jgi:hypothetical protein
MMCWPVVSSQREPVLTSRWPTRLLQVASTLPLDERGQRLPTEAEWEFAWSAVQAQPANWMLAAFELVADGWRADLEDLQGVDPLVAGGPGVLKTVSVNPLEVESIFPLRQPFSGSRIATIRAALDVPR